MYPSPCPLLAYSICSFEHSGFENKMQETKNAIHIQQYWRELWLFSMRNTGCCLFCYHAGRAFAISSYVETTSILIIPAFVVGAVFSAFAGNIGMHIATEANARTTQAARKAYPRPCRFLWRRYSDGIRSRWPCCARPFFISFFF